jgi:hypothetical protein
MKKIFSLFIVVVTFSCGNEKVLQLPEVNSSEISEINDVSHAYLFYDETQANNIELNRKNLISTTNWLINVDKRLTLKQAIPKIKFLQDKKSNSSHKNKNAKNYFTCHDLNSNNLGFIEFTDVAYQNESLDDYSGVFSNLEDAPNSTAIAFEKNNDIIIASTILKTMITETSIDSLQFYLKKCDTINGIIFLNFNEDLSFQSYIDFKSVVNKSALKYTKISNKEFIFN